MSHLKLYTQMIREFSAGLVCFYVDGIGPEEVVRRMHDKGIIMSRTPYRESYPRFAPSLINNENEIDRALAAIAEMK